VTEPYHRTLTDAAGRTWVVRKFSPSTGVALTPDHARGWLTFERDDGERRRLVPAPDDWERMTDAALSAAIEVARPVGEDTASRVRGWLDGTSRPPDD
jgi:hypothetical protein